MITDEDKERVRQATDLVALVAETVELRQRGQEFWGCCPFHGEKNPSFKVNPNTGLWHCFGCGEGGDVFSYVQKRENLEFPDAIRYLADRAGIELAEERGGQRGPRRNRLIECLTEAESFYSTMLMRSRSEGAAQARAYFAGRGFGSDVCRRWGLGYAPGHGALVAHLRQKGFSAREIVAADLAVDRSGRPSDRFYERVMFPIHDELGRTIAFGGRIMGKKKDVAKYVNTRDTAVFNKGKHLFAYDRAKQTMAATGQAIVCEGYTDVIAMHEAGFTNAVAALGTAFRLDHVKLMERQRVHRITCMFDGDAAGQRAAERAVRYIDKTTAEFRCVVLPDDMDPMEFLAARGADELRPILEAAEPLMDFVFAKRLEGLDLSVPGRRVAALKDMALLLAPLKHSVLLDDYATRLADTLGLEVEDTKRAIREAPVQDADDERPRRGGGPQGAAGGSGARRQAATPARKPRGQAGLLLGRRGAHGRLRCRPRDGGRRLGRAARVRRSPRGRARGAGVPAPGVPLRRRAPAGLFGTGAPLRARGQAGRGQAVRGAHRVLLVGGLAPRGHGLGHALRPGGVKPRRGGGSRRRRGARGAFHPLRRTRPRGSGDARRAEALGGHGHGGARQLPPAHQANSRAAAQPLQGGARRRVRGPLRGGHLPSA